MTTDTASLTPTAGTTPAVRFHLTLADRTESDAVCRYHRFRRLSLDVVDAARRADAIMRLEWALCHTVGSHFA